MKIRTILVAVLALVVLMAIAIGVLMGRVDSWRPRIQAELQDKLHRDVGIAHLSLKLLPLEIHVEGLTIGEANGFPQERPFAKANDVFVSAGLFSLLTGNPEVKDLILDKPQIELVRNGAGVWNYSSLGGNGSSQGSGKTALSLNLLEINDGQVGYTDELNKQPRNVYDHIDLKLTDFAPDKEFGLKLGVHLPGQGQQLVEFDGKAGPLKVASENAVPPIQGHLSIKQASLAAINQFNSGSLPPDTNAILSGEADIHSMADVVSAKGNLKMDDTVLKGAKMGYPINAIYDVEDDFEQKKVLIHSGNLQLGATSFAFAGDLNGAVTPMLLNVNLKTDNSSVTELAKLAGGLGVGFSPAYNVAGTVSADVTARGAMNAPQLSGSLKAKNLAASGGEIKQPVSIPEIDLTLSPDSIMSNTFSATSGSTTLSIAFTLLQYASANRSIDATVKTDGAKVGELLNIAKAYGVDAAQGMTGDGGLSLNLHAKGPLANASAMSYAGTANLTNVTLNTPQIKKPVSIASANVAFSQNSVNLDNLAATLGSTTVKGDLSAKNFAAPEVAFHLTADKIDTDELQSLFVSTPAKPAAKGSQPQQPPSLLLATTGTGTLQAGTIKANDIVLKDVNTTCTLDKGVIHLSPLSAGVFGGQTKGDLTLDMRATTTQCGAKLTFTNVDANGLLSAVSSMKNTVYGNLGGNTNIHFALVDSNNLARTLNGTLAFNLTKGEIKNVNLLGEVRKIGKLMGGGGTDTGDSTEIKKFQATWDLVNGVASTQNLTGELSEGTITGKGSLDLAKQEINMHMTAQLAGGSANAASGGGLMNTVLATSRNGLMVPVIVTGNMAHPNVTPDAAEMAKLKLSNLTGGKGAAGLVNGILGGADAKTKKNSSPFGSILNQIPK